ncbi:MAG: hypothetical protein ABIQ18_27130 [Umezawaea sp.]
MRLPTDTQHIRLRTRQFELFNRSLGQGIERRTMLIAAVAAGVWWLVLFIVGMPVLTRFSPLVYLVPPAFVVINGTRQDDSGRMVLMGWYDWLLSRRPARRRVIRNPLLNLESYSPTILRLSVTTELLHRTGPNEESPSTGTAEHSRQDAA